MTTMSVVGECFFWYRLIRVVPDKFHRAVKRLCVCVCVCVDAIKMAEVMHAASIRENAIMQHFLLSRNLNGELFAKSWQFGNSVVTVRGFVMLLVIFR